MKSATKELVTLTMILVLAFLVLTHFTGFSRDVGALGGNWAKIIQTFQGR